MSPGEVKAYATEIAAKLLQSHLRRGGLDELFEIDDVFPGDREVLRRGVVALAVDLFGEIGVLACTVCGCTEDDACIDDEDPQAEPCSWVRVGVCSACDDVEPRILVVSR